MTDKITFYAVVDDDTDVDHPYGLVRRLDFRDGGYTDEGLRRDLSWSFTPLIAEWRRGKFDDELVEVTHTQATSIIEYFRGLWGATG
ncbi:MAG: hypothetical protein ACYCO9_06560 [Streptosporangiaceae bacterium]